MNNKRNRHFLLPCSLRKWKFSDGKKKIVFEIIADSDCTTQMCITDRFRGVCK